MSRGATLAEARAAKREALRMLHEQGTTAAVAVHSLRDGGYGLKINLREALPAGATLPEQLGGVPIEIAYVGRVRRRREE